MDKHTEDLFFGEDARKRLIEVGNKVIEDERVRKQKANKEFNWDDYYGEEAVKQRLEWYKKYREEQIEEQKRNGTYIDSEQQRLEEQIRHEQFIKQCDVPGAMDDTTALVLYIIVMCVSIIFKHWWLIWIVATALFLKHKFRREIHNAKWDREHKDKK